MNRGRFNFGEVRYDYFREPATQFEAFKVGQIDYRDEDDPSRWAERYRFAAVDGGPHRQGRNPVRVCRRE